MARGFLAWMASKDIFGEPVTLSYRGDSSFKTRIGAFLSIIYMIVMMTYAVSELTYVINQNNITTSTFTVKQSLEEGTLVNLNEVYFSVAVSFLEL